MNFEIDSYKLFKDEFENYNNYRWLYRYAKPFLAEAYELFLITSDCVKYRSGPFKNGDYHDYIKNNDINGAKKIICWWFFELDLCSLFKSEKDVISELEKEIKEKITHTENFFDGENFSKQVKSQKKLVLFYFVIRDAFTIFEIQSSKAQLKQVSSDRKLARYFKFIKANPDYFQLILSAKIEDAEDLAALYCNEIREIGQNTPFDLIINGWRAEKRKDKQQ